MKLSPEFKVLISFCLLGVFVFLAGRYFITIQHEQAHHATNKIFDLNSRYSVSLLEGKTFVPEADLNGLSESDYRTWRSLQSANEVYGYQVFALLGVFFISFFLQMVFIYMCFVMRNERGP